GRYLRLSSACGSMSIRLASAMIFATRRVSTTPNRMPIASICATRARESGGPGGFSRLSSCAVRCAILLAQCAEHLRSREPDQRSGALRGQAFDVNPTNAALLERHRTARTNQMRGELTEIRFVADERDSTPLGYLGKLGQNMLRRVARS